jgi:hypothetical protein
MNLGTPHIQAKMQRLRLQRADSRMVQLTSDMPGDVKHSQSYDLIGDSTGNRSDPFGNNGIHRLGRLSLSWYRLEIEDLPRGWNRAPVDSAGSEIDQ